MAESKALSKGSPENKLIESTDSDKKSSGSTTSYKSVQSTSTSNIQTTNNDAADDKSKSQSYYERLNLLFHFIHSLFNNCMLCLPKVNLYINFMLNQKTIQKCNQIK